MVSSCITGKQAAGVSFWPINGKNKFNDLPGSSKAWFDYKEMVKNLPISLLISDTPGSISYLRTTSLQFSLDLILHKALKFAGCFFNYFEVGLLILPHHSRVRYYEQTIDRLTHR